MAGQMMSAPEWARLEAMAQLDGLTDAQVFGLAVGCPVHGNASMDYDDDGIFCHRCESSEWAATIPGEPSNRPDLDGAA